MAQAWSVLVPAQAMYSRRGQGLGHSCSPQTMMLMARSEFLSLLMLCPRRPNAPRARNASDEFGTHMANHGNGRGCQHAGVGRGGARACGKEHHS